MTTPHHHSEEPLELIVGSTRVQLGRQLGEGGFAFIYVAVDSNTSARYVLKKTIIQDVTTRDLVKKEVKLLKRLQHPNIVQYVDSCVVPAGSGRKMEAMILMEYCSGGSLMEVIRKRGSHRFEKTDIMRISRDTASALALLHHQSPPIAHRDMKLENVLLNHKGMYKLIDFGSAAEGPVSLTNAAERSEEEERIAKYTTPMYRSPEMVDLYMRRQLDEKVDIWALGCIFFAVVHLVHPLTETGNLAILNRRIRKVTVPPDLVDMQELIDRMLQVDADARLDINEVLQLLELIAAGQPLPPRTRIGKQEEQERKMQAAKAVSPRSRRTTTSPTAPPPPVEARKLDPNSAAARRLAQRGMGATGGAAMSGTTSLLDVSSTAAAERETVQPSEGIQALSLFDGPSEQQSARRPSGDWSAPPQARRPSFDSASSNLPFSSPAQQLPLSNDSPFGDDFAMFGAAPVGGAHVTTTTADDTLNVLCSGGGVGGQVLNDGGEADWLASFSGTPGPVSPAPPAQDLSIDTFFSSNPSVNSTNTGSSLAFAPFGDAPSPAASTPKAFQITSPAHALFHSPSSASPHAQSGNRPTTPSTAELLSLPLPAQPTPTPPRAPAFMMSPHSGANDPLRGLSTPTSLPPRTGGHLRLGSFGSGGGSGNMTMGGFPAPASSTSTSVDPFAALTPEVVSPATSQRASYGSASPRSASYSSPVYASPYGSGSMARGPSYGFASPMGSVSSMGSIYSSGGGLSTMGSQGGMGMGGASPTLYQTPQGSPQLAAYGSGASSAQMFMPPRPQQAPAYGANSSVGMGHPMTQYHQQPPYAQQQQQQQPLGTKAAKAADPFADLGLGF